MAEQATKEPTMEEILASIRRIISEDGSPVDEASAAEISATPDEDDGFLDLQDDFIDLDKPVEGADDHAVDAAEGHLLSVEELLESEAGFNEIDALSDFEDMAATQEPANDPLEEVFAEAELDETVAQIEADVFSDNIQETIAEPAEVSFETEPVQEAVEMATPQETAPAAAAPLAALAGGSTIEGMVAELMKPMIKEWIDTNLPGIVERKVEAEIQQVANKVVAALRD